VTLNLAEMSVAKSRPSVPYGANLFTSEISWRKERDPAKALCSAKKV